jgi:uncharacterized protein (DUF2141 family)
MISIGAVQTGGERKAVNGSTIRKSAVGRAHCAAWLLAWMFICIPSIAFAKEACPGIHVVVLNIRNSTGTVACALFKSSKGFPTEYLRSATNIMVIKVHDKKARFDFLDIPPGTYSLVVVHDENMNGKLDTNWLGIPTEGYGFSNNAKALLGAPTYTAAMFLYNGKNLDMTVEMHY